MKNIQNISFLLLLMNSLAYGQTPCEQKLKNAKNSIIAIVNSGGGNDKINQTATDIMTNMALNCPETIDEFNKFIQNLGKKGNTDKDLDGKVKGDYQTNQERQKALEEYNKQNTLNSAGQGANNTGSPNNNNSNRTGNNQSGMRGDGYAELPFKETNENTNNNGRNTGSQKAGGGGATGNALEQQRQNEQYRNQAHNQIQNGQGGFRAVKNEEDLVAPTVNLDNEIKNFENKLASVPENLKPDLLAKANFILKTETNKQVAAQKLNILMKEFEKSKESFAQKSETHSNMTVWENPEIPPQFPGGTQAFFRFINENIVYPKEAQEKKIEGSVFVSFIIKYDGSISDINVLKGAGYGFDEEAIRVLRTCPNWTPGSQDGRNVNTKFTLPIKFAF